MDAGVLKFGTETTGTGRVPGGFCSPPPPGTHSVSH